MAEVEDNNTVMCLAKEWGANADELRRVFIFNRMAAAEIDGCVTVKNMRLLEHYMKTGELLDDSAAHRKGATLLAIAGGNSL